MPLATFIMTAFNSADTIEESVKSILDQSFTDFDLIIIDDCSKDATSEIINSFNDNRIRYFRNQQNIHIAKSANKALQIADSEYILRIDSDDICYPDRLTNQLDFMKAHPETGVCGSYVRHFGLKNDVWKMPLKNKEIKAYMMFNNPLANSSVIIRRNVLKENDMIYRSVFSYPPMEDYDLWFRLIDKTDFANIDKILIKRNLAKTSQSIVHQAKRKQALKQFFTEHLNDLFSVLSDEEKMAFVNLSVQDFGDLNDKKIGDYLSILQKAHKILSSRNHIDNEALRKRCRIKMMRMMMQAKPKQWRRFSKEIAFFGGKHLFIKYLAGRIKNG